LEKGVKGHGYSGLWNEYEIWDNMSIESQEYTSLASENGTGTEGCSEKGLSAGEGYEYVVEMNTFRFGVSDIDEKEISIQI
jgi:hypothetical protein